MSNQVLMLSGVDELSYAFGPILPEDFEPSMDPKTGISNEGKGLLVDTGLNPMTVSSSAQRAVEAQAKNGVTASAQGVAAGNLLRKLLGWGTVVWLGKKVLVG